MTTQSFGPGQVSTDGSASDEAGGLGGVTSQRVGAFRFYFDDQTWEWSEQVQRMHGYEPGTVTPTTELVLSHKHPDDLTSVRALLKRSSAPFSSRHRIRTASGEIRKVVVVGEAVTNQDGQVVATRGFYVDVTEAVYNDIQRVV